MSSRSPRSRGRTTPWRMVHPFGSVIPRCLPLAVAAVLGGCATLPGGGMIVPAALAKGDLHKDVAALRSDSEKAEAAARVAGLARRTLNAESAVQIALLN